MGMRDSSSEQVMPREPICPKKQCQLEIVDIERKDWTAKEATGEHAGKDFEALKLQYQITDPNITTETDGARPQTILEDIFNIERYPYMSKKTDRVEWMGPNKLFQIQEALGFDTVYKDSEGNALEARVSSRTGKKMAPKGDDVHRHLNPDFLDAYFDSENNPKVMEWVGKTIYANIDYKKQSEEQNEQYGKKNAVVSYVAPPST